jgi:hypothetical protein
LDEKSTKIFNEHLERYIGKFIKEKKFDFCYSLLKKVPYSLPLFDFLQGLSQRQILKLGDYLLDNREYCGALRMYQLFFEYYPKAKNGKNLLKTCDGIFDVMRKKEDWEKVKKLKSLKANNILSLRIGQYIEIKEEQRF